MRVTDSGHGQSETANSAAATAGRRTYAGPGGFQVVATTGWLGTGYSQQDSQTAPASSIWPAVAGGSTAVTRRKPLGGLGGPSSGLGAAGRRTRRLQGLISHQCRVIGESVLRPMTCATDNNGLSGQGQRSVSTSSRRKAGPPPGPADFHVCQARRAGPWDLTAAGQPGRPAASVQSSTTWFMSDHSQTLPSGGSLPTY